MGQPFVYSYTRFSDPRQATGSSSERQAEYAARWAAERGLKLDSSLTLRDEGLSAYHQKHVTQGALGAFLRAVDEGRIPSGSVLIVEGLDRLSRAEPIQAQAQLAQVINAGITVVTASDGREYNRAQLKAQPMDLVYSLLVMIRAHEESDTKSKRVKAAIRRQIEGWIAGTNRTIIRNGTDPAWLRLNGGKWEFIPERVAAVREVVRLYGIGYGGIQIVRELTERGLSFASGPPRASQIYRTVRLRSLVGERTFVLDGQEYTIPGYYPAILTEAEFAHLQLCVSNRPRQVGKGTIPAIVTGIGVLYCGYCGNPMTGQTMYHRAKTDGTLNPGHRRMLCVGYTHGSGCVGDATCSVVPLENAILDFCSDQMNLTALTSGGDVRPALMDRLNTLRVKRLDLEKQIDRVTSALLASEGDTPLAFVRRARELEEQMQAVDVEIQQAEFELPAAGQPQPSDAVDAWISARDGAKALNYDDRMKVRELVIQTFSRIVVYQRGMTKRPKSNFMDILLIGRRGHTRVLRINRRTGAWHAAEDVAAFGNGGE